MSQESQIGALYQPIVVEWGGRWEGGFNSRFMQAEERNSRLKDRRFEIIKFKEQKKGMFSL